jgi:predicted ATPase
VELARFEYQRRLELAADTIVHLNKKLGRFTIMRSVLFFGMIAAFLLAYLGDIAPGITKPLGWGGLVAFFVAIVWNEQVRLRQLEAKNQHDLFSRLLARLDRRWKDLPDRAVDDQVPLPAYSDDLDLSGPSSLLALINLAGTLPGIQTLRGWLADPANWTLVKARQSAVKSLAPLRDFRLEVVQQTSATSFGQVRPYGLVEWAQTPSWLGQHRPAVWLSYLGPTILWLGLGLLLVGRFNRHDPSMDIGFLILASGVVINILITILWGGWIHAVFQRVAGQQRSVQQFGQIFQLFNQLPQDGGQLDAIRKTCTEGPNCAIAGFKSLKKLVKLAQLQRNALLYLVYLALQMLLLWDFRVLAWLERWKIRFKADVGNWFDALGRCEALICAATLADEHPTWSFPVACQDQSFLLRGREVGHPLLAESACVTNDIELTQHQPLVLITGSNMAGKSTFMRAVGINLVLARTGAPVCAAALETPLYELATSVRIRDSLADGVSFFMAELKRLKSVVDHASQQRLTGSAPILFLLDEVLQGTNSRERQIAVAHVVQRLVKLGTCGFLSTHDLDLASVPSVQQVAQVVHFREYFKREASGQQVMHFDYKLRPGPTPTTNALRLLELVGLSDPT